MDKYMHTFEYQQSIAENEYGGVGESGDTSPIAEAYASLPSNVQNKKSCMAPNWTFDTDKVRKCIDKMRSKVKVKFTRKKKKS